MVAYQVIGQTTRRVNADVKVTGQAHYSADIFLPGTLWGKSLHSPSVGRTRPPAPIASQTAASTWTDASSCTSVNILRVRTRHGVVNFPLVILGRRRGIKRKQGGKRPCKLALTLDTLP